MENKPKECKGTGKAKGFGCGEPFIYRKYGLCSTCQYRWAKESKEGKEWFRKGLIKTKKTFEIEAKKQTKEKKIDLMSLTAYWSKIVQPNINAIARLIDHDQPCIATGNTKGKMNGGHYFSVGSNRTISLNLHNIHVQSEHSNKWKSGDDKNYRQGLITIYGGEYLEFIQGFTNCTLLKLTKKELIQINKKARKIRNELKKDLKKLDPLGRILLRNKVNCELNIYPDKYLTF